MHCILSLYMYMYIFFVWLHDCIWSTLILHNKTCCCLSSASGSVNDESIAIDGIQRWSAGMMATSQPRCPYMLSGGGIAGCANNALILNLPSAGGHQMDEASSSVHCCSITFLPFSFPGEWSTLWGSQKHSHLMSSTSEDLSSFGIALLDSQAPWCGKCQKP